MKKQHHTQGIYVNQTKTYGGNLSAQKNYQASAESDHVERTQCSARVTLQVLYDLQNKTHHGDTHSQQHYHPMHQGRVSPLKIVLPKLMPVAAWGRNG